MVRWLMTCLLVISSSAALWAADPPVKKAPPLNTPAAAAGKAPAEYRVRFNTTKGDFVVAVTRDWSPNGADRFYELVQAGFFDDVKFFRAVKGFMVQFGISGDPKVSAQWRERTIVDDPVKQSNQRGYITFAKTGLPNSRTTQLFINYGDNSRLDQDGFAPFGKITEGMDVVDKLYQGYGEQPSQAQGQIQREGNAFLEKAFPKLDAIKTAKIVE
jgi:peptidyl-prolyl cis-trans isomerase A (cyclophilin A)